MRGGIAVAGPLSEDVREPVPGRLALKTATGGVLFAERTIEREPADRPGDPFRAVDDASAGQDARPDAGADREKDCVAASACRTPPNFAGDRRLAVTGEDDFCRAIFH